MHHKQHDLVAQVLKLNEVGANQGSVVEQLKKKDTVLDEFASVSDRLDLAMLALNQAVCNVSTSH